MNPGIHIQLVDVIEETKNPLWVEEGHCKGDSDTWRTESEAARKPTVEEKGERRGCGAVGSGVEGGDARPS